MDLTVPEQRAMDLTAELANALSVVVLDGSTRNDDLRELFGHIHAIQHAIGFQAFARAHPNEYRRLGSTV